VVAAGRPILFVGTKKQAKGVIKDEAERVGTFYVAERWLGGMLTNFHTIKAGIKRLKDIEKMEEDGTLDKYTKKEAISIQRQKQKLTKVLGGIKEMTSLPGLIYVIDCKKEKIAVAEAAKLNIPIVAIIDTNADPDLIDFPIAANDDAIKSIRIITNEIADAVYEAKHGATVREMSTEFGRAGEDEGMAAALPVTEETEFEDEPGDAAAEA
jgi:small subunit ribosomal protein S2